MNSSWATGAARCREPRQHVVFASGASDLLNGRRPPSMRWFAFKSIGRVTHGRGRRGGAGRAQLVSGNFYAGVGVCAGARPVGPRCRTTTRQAALTLWPSSATGFWARRLAARRPSIGRQIRRQPDPRHHRRREPGAVRGHRARRTHGSVHAGSRSSPSCCQFRYGDNGSLLDNPDYWWLQIMGRTAPRRPVTPKRRRRWMRRCSRWCRRRCRIEPTAIDRTSGCWPVREARTTRAR